MNRDPFADLDADPVRRTSIHELSAGDSACRVLWIIFVIASAIRLASLVGVSDMLGRVVCYLEVLGLFAVVFGLTAAIRAGK